MNRAELEKAYAKAQTCSLDIILERDLLKRENERLIEGRKILYKQVDVAIGLLFKACRECVYFKENDSCNPPEPPCLYKDVRAILIGGFRASQLVQKNMINGTFYTCKRCTIRYWVEHTEDHPEDGGDRCPCCGYDNFLEGGKKLTI